MHELNRSGHDMLYFGYLRLLFDKYLYYIDCLHDLLLLSILLLNFVIGGVDITIRVVTCW